MSVVGRMAACGGAGAVAGGYGWEVVAEGEIGFRKKGKRKLGNKFFEVR